MIMHGLYMIMQMQNPICKLDHLHKLSFNSFAYSCIINEVILSGIVLGLWGKNLEIIRKI